MLVSAAEKLFYFLFLTFDALCVSLKQKWKIKTKTSDYESFVYLCIRMLHWKSLFNASKQYEINNILNAIHIRCVEQWWWFNAIVTMNWNLIGIRCRSIFNGIWFIVYEWLSFSFIFSSVFIWRAYVWHVTMEINSHLQKKKGKNEKKNANTKSQFSVVCKSKWFIFHGMVWHFRSNFYLCYQEKG